MPLPSFSPPASWLRPSGGDDSPSPSPAVSSSDDNGGELDRDLRFEPGDDRDVNGSGMTASGSYDDD
ncbi:MAG TPA: hypothetical protein VK894_02895 [Jiangellales bacterium]|nr:hypothetical protein [Jiangellales bacterium]